MAGTREILNCDVIVLPIRILYSLIVKYPGEVLFKCRSSIGEVSVVYQSSIGHVSVEY